VRRVKSYVRLAIVNVRDTGATHDYGEDVYLSTGSVGGDAFARAGVYFLR
jgi:hypothetical protein